MLLKSKTLSIAIIALISLISCDKARVYDQYASIDKGWNSDEAFVFEYENKNTITPYNYFINMRANKDFPFHNLFLIVETHTPNKTITVDTLEYLMAKPDGTLLGNGFSDIKESKLWFKEDQNLPEIGMYKYRIYQAVRETGKVKGVKELNGITEVGFRIEKTNNDE